MFEVTTYDVKNSNIIIVYVGGNHAGIVFFQEDVKNEKGMIEAMGETSKEVVSVAEQYAKSSGVPLDSLEYNTKYS